MGYRVSGSDRCYKGKQINRIKNRILLPIDCAHAHTHTILLPIDCTHMHTHTHMMELHISPLYNPKPKIASSGSPKPSVNQEC